MNRRQIGQADWRVEIAQWAGIALVVGVGGWVLTKLIPAIGAGLGYLAAGAIHGVVTGAVAGWFSQAALIGGSVAIAGGGITVTVNIIKKLVSKPYSAAAATLAVCQSFLVDLVKIASPGGDLARLILKATTVLLFGVAAALWKSKSRSARVTAVLVFLINPIVVLSYAISPYLNETPRNILGAIPQMVWWQMLAFILCAVAAMMAEKYLRDRGELED